MPDDARDDVPDDRPDIAAGDRVDDRPDVVRGDTAGAASSASSRGRVRTALVTVIAVALLAAAVAGGFAWGDHGAGRPAAAGTPTSGSVEAGFARDMSVHHRQAVTMAEYAQARTSDPDIKLLAFDIDATQSVQLGEMQGWLESWNLSPTDGQMMAWMGHAHMVHDGLMPGMATPSELSALQSSTGKAVDVRFLQLMIRHHQGGVAMAQYAAEHAEVGYVRSLAQKMVDLQSSEIVQMEQLLRQRGGQTLPAPAI